MRRTAAAISAALLLALTGCAGSDGSSEAKPSSASPTAREYDVHDCNALLERNFAADKNRDASGEAECKHLTDDEYGDVVKEVLTGRKDEILDTAASETAWDIAWDQTPNGQ